MVQNKNPVVYRAINKVTGKYYIGFDSSWPKRKIAHKTKAKTGSKTYFHSTIRKYGWESFEWEILKMDATLDDEILMIEHYKSNDKSFGYNLTVGGEGAKGYKHTDDARKKIRSASMGRQPTLGYKHTAAAREKIKNASVSRQQTIWELRNLETSEIVIVDRLKDFCKLHSLSYSNLIAVANGRRKHSRGYVYRKIQ